MRTPVLGVKEQGLRKLRAIDSLLQDAGLVRSRRGGAVHNRRNLPRKPATPQAFTLEAPVPKIASNGAEWLPVPGWEKLDWLWHGFSTRRGGLSHAYCADCAQAELNLGFTKPDDRENVDRNRRLLAEAITADAGTRLVVLRQLHSKLVRVVGAQDAGRELPLKGDGLVTAEPGFLLAIQTADCIPVLIADRKNRVVGAFHAGWRGTVRRIVESGVGLMRLEFDCSPKDMTAAIGPGIGGCCYAIGEEVLSAFESQFSYAEELFDEVYDSDPVRMKYPMLFLTQRAPGHSPIGPQLHLDLIEANRRQLLDAGLPANSIHLVGGCTSCRPDLFFSHRQSRGHAGRMMSVIGIRPK